MNKLWDWECMRESIIGLGDKSSRKSFYPELQLRLVQLEAAREELRRSEENLRTVFRAMPDAVFVCDTSWEVLEVNEAAFAMFGIAPGQRPSSFLQWSGEAGEPLFRHARERLEREAQILLAWPAKRTGGDAFEAEASLRKARWYEQEAILVVVRDVSERKRLEAMLRQSQKLEALGQLAGGMAHDTNNMLGVILGYVDLLEERLAGDAQGMADLAQVRKAALRSSDLIRQLLAFARKQTIQPRVTDLNALVEDTQRMLRRLLGENIELVWKPGVLPGQIWVDPGQLDQVLANLVVNARDAIDGSGTITLETRVQHVDPAFCQIHPEAYPGRYVCLSITDTGKGMSPEIRARIFEPFFTTKEPGRGTGLGLATVYGILRQHCGFICVSSEPGKGSTFRLCFPLLTAPLPGMEEASAEAAPPGGSETLLLVEDEEDLLALERTILAGAGYHVIAASGPKEAQRLALEDHEDLKLLITDLVMPGMSGWELHQQIVAQCPGIRSLFMSGYPSETVHLEETLGPGRDFLPKPFTRISLLRKVRQVLDVGL